MTIHGEPHRGAMEIVDCSRWREGHRCRAECAPQVSLEHAMELGRRVQEMLEPPPFQRFEEVTADSWMSVSQRVGGDFQSIYSLGRRIRAIQGDVMGKGLNAALLAAYLVGLFEGLSRQELPLPEVLARMNCCLAERTRNRPMFATALVLEVDLAAREWSFSRAGHELPLLVRYDGRICRLPKGGALPLGVDLQERFSAFHLPLQAGDRLLVYTDGALEVGLNQERLREALTRPRLGIPDVVALLAAPPYRDDVSLLLLSCDPPT
ncbi:MAG: serine/threonine-protein phosphatase [Candidatus Eremiobacteraeota bacterium]|nr:serine/threonine-protein phosphatase [Candidatus Eremiobacteraeota bacterium]MCW5871201.1 serine/threonine-protein phosphatase [Candidatus Eremiobacteraeota bacterium]